MPISVRAYDAMTPDERIAYHVSRYGRRCAECGGIHFEAGLRCVPPAEEGGLDEDQRRRAAIFPRRRPPPRALAQVRPAPVGESRPCISFGCTRPETGIWTDECGNKFPACDVHRNDLRRAQPTPAAGFLGLLPCGRCGKHPDGQRCPESQISNVEID